MNGQKWCKGCRGWLPVENFANSDPTCVEDHNALQNIRIAAKNQGQEEWLEEQISDDTTLARMVSKYKMRIKLLAGNTK